MNGDLLDDCLVIFIKRDIFLNVKENVLSIVLWLLDNVGPI
jgi:hypothetical protein